MTACLTCEGTQLVSTCRGYGCSHEMCDTTDCPQCTDPALPPEPEETP